MISDPKQNTGPQVGISTENSVVSHATIRNPKDMVGTNGNNQKVRRASNNVFLPATGPLMTMSSCLIPSFYLAPISDPNFFLLFHYHRG